MIEWLRRWFGAKDKSLPSAEQTRLLTPEAQKAFRELTKQELNRQMTEAFLEALSEFQENVTNAFEALRGALGAPPAPSAPANDRQFADDARSVWVVVQLGPESVTQCMAIGEGWYPLQGLGTRFSLNERSREQAVVQVTPQGEDNIDATIGEVLHGAMSSLLGKPFFDTAWEIRVGGEPISFDDEVEPGMVITLRHLSA